MPFSHASFSCRQIFNESNPSGEVVRGECSVVSVSNINTLGSLELLLQVDSSQYHRMTAVAVAVGVIVSCKRFWLGLHLGRQTFGRLPEHHWIALFHFFKM